MSADETCIACRSIHRVVNNLRIQQVVRDAKHTKEKSFPNYRFQPGGSSIFQEYIKQIQTKYHRYVDTLRFFSCWQGVAKQRCEKREVRRQKAFSLRAKLHLPEAAFFSAAFAMIKEDAVSVIRDQMALLLTRLCRGVFPFALANSLLLLYGSLRPS